MSKVAYLETALGQVSLHLDERDHWNRIGKQFLTLLRETVQRTGLKEVAFALGLDIATLHHALAGRKRHVPHAEWVPIILALAPDDAALEFLAALRGRDLIAAAPLEPEEEVLALRAVIGELPSDFRDAIEARVRQWRRNNPGGRR